MCRSGKGWFVCSLCLQCILKLWMYLVLRILRISDPVRSRKSLSQSHGHISSSGAADLNPRLCTGPGGASIEIGPNMWTASGLKIDSAPTDVVWARGSECYLHPLAMRSRVTRTKHSTTRLLLVRGMEKSSIGTSISQDPSTVCRAAVTLTDSRLS
jgi:hypothetical protein